MARYGKLFLIQVEEVEADGGDPAGYVATNDELGLVVEADTLDDLKARVSELAPELYELNTGGDPKAAKPAFVLQYALGGARAENVLP
jgi:hypothetical protein